MGKKIILNLPPTTAQSNDLIFMLLHHYETTGLSILKTAANELQRLYGLFQLDPAEVKHYTPEIVIRMGVVMKVSCRYFGVSQEEVISHSRKLKCMIPRQIIMYLAREITNLSYPQIGNWFNRDHTTIVHAYQKISEQIKTQSQVKKYVDEITVLCQKEALEEHKRIQEIQKCPESIQLVQRSKHKKTNLAKPTPQPIRLLMDV